MATSDTQICNLALSRFGNDSITSLGEGTPTADLCSLHYVPSRDAVLRAHPWNFAIKRATLATDPTAPIFEYDLRHALPADCLKVVRTEWEADGIADIPYRIEGRYLLCNESVVRIEYIARITDVGQFDDLFTDLLAQRLAAEMCLRLTGNQSLTKGLWDIYGAKLSEARTVDAQEGTPREVVDVSPWLSARA